ncbi:hypothetical protein PRNP1_008870 [Phytophthora ramorum]
MLFLPLEEDSLLFRLCLYYGLLVLLLELLVPLLFQRRVRIEIPWLALRGPAVPLSTREFQQRRLALQQQLAALQRALAETPRRSPQKRRQLLSARQREEDPIMDRDKQTTDSEQRKPITDFQAFCASFATGGSVAAQQAAAKRKHHEAFGLENEQTIGDTTAAQRGKYKQPRVREDNDEQSDLTASPVATEPQRVKSPKHYEAFGSDDEQAIDEAFADQQVLQKRTHHQAFRTEKEERPHEKTPRIVRRISFTDEVNALAASPPKEAAAEQSNGKRKHQQAFGMIDEDDEDAEWRDSLAFRPHQFG